MDELMVRALTTDVTDAATATSLAAVAEAERHADAVVGVPPTPGTPEWDAEQGTDLPARREQAWQVLQLRIELKAGIDPIPVLVGLRRIGTSWELIGRAAGVSRQSAHERWAHRVSSILQTE